MRITIETAGWVAVAFRVHAAEFVRATDVTRHRPIARLGPDLLAPDFDLDEVVRRMRVHAGAPIAEVLLDQRALAGIGNVYKSEVLFLAGLHPDTLIEAIDDASLRKVIALARRLLHENIVEHPGPSMVTYRSGRRTTGRMRPQDRLWVYRRGGQPCRSCRTPISSRKSGDDARVTYWCPTCQRAEV